MAFVTLELRHVAAGFVAIFLVHGVALSVVGVAILRANLLGGIAAILAGVALDAYAVTLAVRACRGRFPEWLRAIIHSPPL
jgi:hypothetical protein